jgi:hypothetical protein
MKRIAVLLPGLLLAFSAHADPLAALRERLQALPAATPVQARVEITSQATRGEDEPAPPPATLRLEARAAEGSLRLDWPGELLGAARRERLDANPDAERPVGRALSQVSPIDIDAYLDATPTLLSTLDEATLQSQSDVEWQGQPATVLELRLQPKIGERDRKYVKEAEGSARLWIGADGLPLAAERSYRIAGRAMLVISFESKQDERFTFGRHGDRLVVLSHRGETASSGAGEEGTQVVEARLTIADVQPATR